MPSVSAEEREAIRAIANQGLRASVGVSIRLKREEVDQAFECGAQEAFIICPVSSLHVRSKLGLDEEGVKRLVEGIVRYASERGLLVDLVAEDASRADISFRWGAKRAFICDTVGGMDPFKFKDLVRMVREKTPPEMGLGVHCHNDLGLATANTLASIEAGASYPSVTVNGIGERAGNPPLHEIVMALEKIFHLEHGIDLKKLYDLSKLVERCSGIFIPPHAPLVGLNAFRHESGIHVDGILKNSQTYKIIDPKEVGRSSSFVLGKHTGTQTILHLLQQNGYEANEAELREILQKVKERKMARGKAEISRMEIEIGDYYEEALNFPMEAFWEIVKGVSKKDV
jgi:isopropylmalate/homocitrate/citramalate synthase